MHEVVGHLHPLPRTPQGVGIEHVPFEQLEPAIGQMAGAGGIANQAADVPAVLSERGGEPAADEAGRSGDKRGATTGHHPGLASCPAL